MSEISIQEMMEKVIRAFQPDKAAGVDACIQFHLTGNQGGSWSATIKDQRLIVESGTVRDPNLSFSADTKDLMDMFSGKLKPMQAYMSGKVQMVGDIGLAMRLVKLFKRP